MSTLRIRLFGTPSLARDGERPEVRVTRTALGLFAYLALHRNRVHSRDRLSALFWADQGEARARSCLSTALWRLRRALDPPGAEGGSFVSTARGGEVAFNRSSDYWLDVEVFEDAVRALAVKPFHALDLGEAGRLEAAVELYTGDVLEGFYEDWALRERERLRALWLTAMGALFRFHGFHGRYDEAEGWGVRLLAADPLREEIHREMMRLYLEKGDRAAAARQFGSCRDRVVEELGVEPMEETLALYRQIAAPTHPEAPASCLSPLGQAFQHLRGALADYDRARAELEQALQLVARVARLP